MKIFNSLYFFKIKTSLIPVSDVLPLFWFFMVQYISISRLIIVFIFYLVNDIINCLYYFSLHLKSKEVKMLKKVILWFTIVVFFLMLLWFLKIFPIFPLQPVHFPKYTVSGLNLYNIPKAYILYYFQIIVKYWFYVGDLFQQITCFFLFYKL